MTDLEAFAVGSGLALSQAGNLSERPHLQLLQYAPSTKRVYRRPSWSFRPGSTSLHPRSAAQNSFIKYAVDQGFTVFVISWVNPDERHADKNFEDYLGRGSAGGAGRDRAGHRRARVDRDRLLPGRHPAGVPGVPGGEGRPAHPAASFFAALTDFASPGRLGVFIDEAARRHGSE